jgi:hypothetical protein
MALPKTFTGGERLFAQDLNDNFNYAVGSDDVNEIVVLTQAAYDILSPSTSTLYIIVG